MSDLQVKEETERLIKGCGIDIRVTALTLSGPSERQQFLNVGQIIVSTPGKIAHVSHTFIFLKSLVNKCFEHFQK